MLLTKGGQFGSKAAHTAWTAPGQDGVFGRQGCYPASISRRSEPQPDSHTQHPFVSPSAESKPIPWRAEMKLGNPSRNSGALQTARLRRCSYWTRHESVSISWGGKYNHMWLKPSHHLVCADMNSLGRVSIWLGKRFPSPSPPHLPCSPSISCRCWNKPLMDFFPTLECWPGERCRSAFWPPATLGYNGPPTLSYLRIKPLAACCQVLSACSTNLV